MAEKIYAFVDSQNLNLSIQRQGWKLDFGRFRKYLSDKYKADYKKAIIVSNDGDFHCLIKYLKEKGKLLKLLIPDKHRYSSLLKEFGSNMDYMNNLRQKLEYKKERH